MKSSFKLNLGVKSDPVEYRYSYQWLFRVMAEEGVEELQLGSFFELYQLPDEWFKSLRKEADEFGIRISSVFTAHRELGGFFRKEPGWRALARRNYRRLIEAGAILGARRVGSNPGAALRDRMGELEEGSRAFIEDMRGEMAEAARASGVEWLTVEPMSCAAEPPTTPDEMRDYASRLNEGMDFSSGQFKGFGFCSDVAHGYLDREGRKLFGHFELLEAALPWLVELHLKNTDARYESTFGFSEKERERGIVEASACRDFLVKNAGRVPVQELTGYLEIGGPKLGRDYSDKRLEDALRASLRHLKESFAGEFHALRVDEKPVAIANSIDDAPKLEKEVTIAPSLMCADFCNLESAVRRLEDAGADMLHIDVMDAHFVPNMPLGLELVRQLRPRTSLPFDIHLMVDDNDFFIRELLPLGGLRVAVHAESARHLDRTLGLVKDGGALAGVALNPATPLEVLDYVQDKLDFVLLMTVNPGFAGQKLVSSAFRKIAECRSYLESRGLGSVKIEVDGNVSFANIPEMVASGGDILIAGTSSLFSREASIAANAAKMREAIAEGLVRRSLRSHMVA